MDSVLDQPAVVILAAAASAVLLVLEVALPTVGLAGTTGLALAALAVWGIDRQDAVWWPLLGVVAAIAVWSGLIAMRRRHPGAHALAVALFLAGGVGYAIATDDWAGAATAIVTSALLAVVFPLISRAAERLVGAKPAVGLESYVGERARVTEWEDGRGRVMLHGSLWSATGPRQVTVGDDVVIANASGFTLEVDTVRSRNG